MDADLSHPPEVLPRMIERLEQGDVEFVIGSRYVEGGTTDEEWSWFRKLNSQGGHPDGATILSSEAIPWPAISRCHERCLSVARR